MIPAQRLAITDKTYLKGAWIGFQAPFKNVISSYTNAPLYVVYQGVVFNVNNVKYYALFVSLFTTYI